MDRLTLAANAIRMRLVHVANRLFGCSHRRTTFPITLRTVIPAGNERQGTSADTYIVCLDCGCTFDFDLATMRPTRKRPTAVGGG